MPLQQEFDRAVEESKILKQRPSNEALLQLYALFKQATEGDIAGERPGGFDFKAIAKHDAWADLKGKTKDQATQEYIDLVAELKKQYGLTGV